MVDRKGYVSIMIVVSFFLSMALAGYAIMLPSYIEEQMQQTVAGQTSFIAAASMDAFVDESYLYQSANWSVYESSYNFAGELSPIKFWGPNSVPTYADFRERFKTVAAQEYEANYIAPDEAVQDGCSIGVDRFQVEIREARNRSSATFGFNYTAGPETRVTISCGGLGRGEVNSETTLFDQKTLVDFSEGNRLFFLSNITRELTMSDGFRRAIASSINRSSNTTVAVSQIQEYGGCYDTGCDALEQTRTSYFRRWSQVKQDFEYEQAEMANDDVEQEIQSWIDGTFLPGFSQREGFDDISIDVETQMSYQAPDSPTQVSTDMLKDDGFEIARCRGSCSVSRKSTDTSCSGSESCTNFRSDWCNAEDDDTTYCSTSDFDDSYSTGRGSLWTEDPWHLSGGEQHTTNPFPQVGLDPDTARMTPFVRPFDQQIRGHPVQQPICDVEDPLCGQDDEGNPIYGSSCCTTVYRHNHNTVDHRVRRAWQMGSLDSTVRVEITVTDERYEIPTEAGMRHMEFQAVYTQTTEGTFQQDSVSMEYPPAEYSCSDQDYYGWDC